MTACGVERRDVAVGNAEDFDEGLTLVEGEGVIVGRDADGLYAMTAMCTHLQCDMSQDGNGALEGGELECTCHGATYDLEGEVTGGPANAPLEHYAVLIAEDGAVTVKVGTVVDAKERTALP
jgi:nitrite reductase/ring-hydroxylating ferredoxin subunit